MKNKEKGELIIQCREDEEGKGYELSIECQKLTTVQVLEMLKGIIEEILKATNH